MTGRRSRGKGRRESPKPEDIEEARADEVQAATEADERTIELGRRCAAVVAPPPKLLVSEWADANRILPPYSAEPGQWRTERTPYLREPMNACCDPGVRKVVMMFGSQLGKSEAELNIGGYFIDNDPAAMMLVQPTKEKAQHFSKQRLAPMLKDTPTLFAKVGPARSRDSDNTIEHKQFPGGFMVLVGSNSPSDLASWPIRILLLDEIDRFEPSAGQEGDPLSLAEKRMSTFWNRKVVICSSPSKSAEESRILAEYNASTRERWYIPCPSCGELQVYDWDRLIFPKQPEPESGEKSGERSRDSETAPNGTARPDAPEMACEHCGALHGEYEWKAGAGQWIAECPGGSTRGFQLNAMASPWLSWADLIEEFLDAKDKGPEVLKVFVNTRLCQCWEEAGESVDEELLRERRHYYNCDVPAEVRVLTAGVDVQADRLELEVVGWGAGKESWGVQYRMIPGDPQRTAVWQELDEYLQGTFVRSDGAVLPISCAAVDSGYATSAVYAFCRPRSARYVFAVKGMGGPGLPVVGPWRRQGKNRDVAVFPVGTDAAKDLLLTRLSVESEGPGYCHFPRENSFAGAGEDGLRGYGDEYFKGLMAEKRVKRRSQKREYHTWIKRYTRNEPLDCRVYATAALEIRNPDLATAAVGKGRRQQATEATKSDAGAASAAGNRSKRGRRVLGKIGGS